MEDDRIADEKDYGNQGNGGEISWRCNGVLSLIHDEEEAFDMTQLSLKS
jgi:hypothetical protein